MFVFISHSGPDTWITRHFAARCQEVSAETFLDEAPIAIGADFETDILTALKKSDEFLVLLTPWALALVEALTKRSVVVWFDEEEMKPGRDAQKALISGLKTSDIYALIIGM